MSTTLNNTNQNMQNNVSTLNTQVIANSSNPVMLDDNKKNLHFKSKKGFRASSLYIAIFMAFLLVACNSPAEKVEYAKVDVAEAKEDLDKAQKEYEIDVEQFRTTTGEKISLIEKEIAEINLDTKLNKRKMSQENERMIADLELKNRNLRLRMNDYNANRKDNWSQFKTEFARDMDELSVALKNFTVDNKK